MGDVDCQLRPPTLIRSMLGNLFRIIIIVVVTCFVLYENWNWSFPNALWNVLVILLAIGLIWKVLQFYERE
jgi:hypothetical protein